MAEKPKKTDGATSKNTLYDFKKYFRNWLYLTGEYRPKKLIIMAESDEKKIKIS